MATTGAAAKPGAKGHLPFPGLRLKVNLLLLAIQLPALCMLVYSSTQGVQELVHSLARSQASRRAAEVGHYLASEDDPESLDERLGSFIQASADVQSVAVFLPDGLRLVRRAFWGSEAPTEPEEDDLFAFHQSRTVERILEARAPDLAIVHTPFYNAEGQAMGVIRISIDQAENVRQVLAYQRQLLAGTVVIFGLTVLVLFGGMHLLVVSPVKKLVGAMARTREGRLEMVAVGTSRDEIGWLAVTYNEMVHRLRTVLGRLKAVVKEKDGLLREVKDLNSNLRVRVAEATRNLEKSHTDLESAYHDLYTSQREHERLQGLASVGQMAREIAHEFSTPLNVISGTLQMLLDERGLSSSQRERLDRVLKQTERLIQICRDTLTPLKMPVPELRPADLNALVQEVGAFMAPAMAARRVELRPSLAASLPPVRADLHLIEQVLLNLLANALDALPGGGSIEVETRAEGSPASPSVVLQVRDDGVGIAPDHLARIFDPFFTTKGAGRGTGLGLSICKEIVTQHGGEIRMESTPGQGSCVTVRLPGVRRLGEAA